MNRILLMSLVACFSFVFYQNAQAIEVTKRERANVVFSKFDTSSPTYKSSEYIEIKTARGATQPFIYKTVGNAKGNIILMKGGNGKVDLSRTKGGGRGNFLVRTRGLFAKSGYNIILPYLPKDKDQMYKFRISADHGNDIAGVVQFLAKENGLKTIVAGTSYSGVSAINVAKTFGEGVDGIILAAVTIYDRFDDDKWTKAYADRKFDADADYGVMKIGLVDATNYTGKVVLLNNKADNCASSALRSDADVMQLFPNAKLKIIHIDGGDDGKTGGLIKRHCRGLTKHGFYRIEEQAVKAAVAAMESLEIKLGRNAPK